MPRTPRGAAAPQPAAGPPPRGASYSVFAALPCGRAHTCDVPAAATVADLKELLAPAAGAPPRRLRVTAGGRALAPDAADLADLGVGSEARVEVVVVSDTVQLSVVSEHVGMYGGPEVRTHQWPSDTPLRALAAAAARGRHYAHLDVVSYAAPSSDAGARAPRAPGYVRRYRGRAVPLPACDLDAPLSSLSWVAAGDQLRVRFNMMTPDDRQEREQQPVWTPAEPRRSLGDLSAPVEHGSVRVHLWGYRGSYIGDLPLGTTISQLLEASAPLEPEYHQIPDGEQPADPQSTLGDLGLESGCTLCYHRDAPTDLIVVTRRGAAEPDSF